MRRYRSILEDSSFARDHFVVSIKLWSKAAAKESVSTAEVLWRELVDMNRTDARANLERVIAFRKRSVIGQLPFVFSGVRLAHLRSATRECVLHVNSRNRVIGVLRVLVSVQTESAFR